MANLLERLDSQLASFLSDWNLNTTILAVIISALVLYPIFFPTEPDTHPLLLARQSAINPVRNKFQSAIYRSPEVSPGNPLRTGLNVKEIGAPRWASGKDGDLRDIWREVQRGGTTIPAAPSPGSSAGAGKEETANTTVPKGLIVTALGQQEMVEHDVEQLSREIQILGKHLKEKGVTRVALYLPNNVEYLLTIFACAFYGVTPVLLPYNLPKPQAVHALIKAAGANALICAAGCLPLDDVAKECTDLRLLTWVVEKSSRDMDWNGAPDFAKKRLSVSVWHEVVEANQAQAIEGLPTNESGAAPVDILTIWESSTKPQIVPFSHANLVSGVSALISAIPLRQRLSPVDVVLPATSFHHPYALCQTLAALYSHTTLVITSVAQAGVELPLATRGVSPTVLIASPETLAKLCKHHRVKTKTSLVEELAKWGFSRSLAAGRLPQPSSMLFRLLAPSGDARDNMPGRLRLILTAERLDKGAEKLTSQDLADLRVFTRSRICYALATARVAGAVAQTHVFDYRILGSDAQHFGVPLSSVEVWLENNSDDAKVGSNAPEGEIVVSGPAVSGYNKASGKGEVKLAAEGRFEEDGTLTVL